MRTESDIVVVTGAGGGLGRALALELVRRGQTVAGLGRTRTRLDLVRHEAGNSGRFIPFECDVGSPEEVRSVFSTIRKLGSVSVLVNNAAVYPHQCLLDETTETFMRTVAVNLAGVVSCSLCALEDMLPRGHGRILNVSTFADGAPLPGSSAYSTSKGAARILTRAMIADICERYPGIVINDWVPGRLATPMGSSDGLDPAVAARWGADLALWNDPSLTGSIWERDTEVLAPRSLRRRVLKKLTWQKVQEPRRLGCPESGEKSAAKQRLSPYALRKALFPSVGLALFAICEFGQ